MKWTSLDWGLECTNEIAMKMVWCEAILMIPPVIKTGLGIWDMNN